MLLSTLDSFFDLMTVLFVFVAVLALTYLTTRFVAGYQKGKGLGRNIEVIETYKITTGKYIQVIKIGEKYLAVGIGKDEIHMLSEINPEDLKLPEGETAQMPAFKDFLNKAKHLRENK